MLQDAFARQFRYLRLSLTERCNFRCGYCLPAGPDCRSEQQELQLTEIAALLRGFAQAGTRKVRLTGGEPSLRKDLTEIIELAHHTHGIDQVAMTTNGYRLRQDGRRWREAGLQQLNISVDSLEPSQFAAMTGHDKLPEILDGIDQLLADGGLRLKLNAVLHRQPSVRDFFEYVRHRPVTVRFIELMQTGQNSAYFQQHHLSATALQNRLFAEGWHLLARGNTDGPALEYSHPDYVGRIGVIAPYSPHFCQQCNRLRVSSTGQLHLCLFTEQPHDIRPWLQDSSVEPLVQRLQQLLPLKQQGHQLHQGLTGQTRHFAMIGG